MAKHSANISVMIKAAEKAARSLLRDFGEVEQLQVSVKGPGNFVSAADKRAEKIIYEELKFARPDYSFLMEESGKIEGKDKTNVWIVDPLDGTSNFLHGIPHWCISIALEEKGEIIAGLIYDPVKDEMFTAEKGTGAFERRKRLRVSGRNDALISMVATGRPHYSFKKNPIAVKEYEAVAAMKTSSRSTGSSALDLAYVAAGRFDAYFDRGLEAWNIAAGYLIVKESGGFICDLDKDQNDVVYTGNVLASNSGLYNDLKKTIRSTH